MRWKGMRNDVLDADDGDDRAALDGWFRRVEEESS